MLNRLRGYRRAMLHEEEIRELQNRVQPEFCGSSQIPDAVDLQVHRRYCPNRSTVLIQGERRKNW
jgi:hypothetical protein